MERWGGAAKQVTIYFDNEEYKRIEQLSAGNVVKWVRELVRDAAKSEQKALTGGTTKPTMVP